MNPSRLGVDTVGRLVGQMSAVSLCDMCFLRVWV
jgi:hypothetical protein